jgi:hypothetical protein
VGLTRLNIFSNFQTPVKLQNSKRKPFLAPKKIQTLHASRYEYFEQVSQLGQLQNLNKIHAINSGTYFNLNLS